MFTLSLVWEGVGRPSGAFGGPNTGLLELIRNQTSRWSFVVFFWVHFTSDPFFLLLPNTTAFYDATAFNADISQWVVSSVTTLEKSKSFLANC